ncbi:protein CcmA, bactofilin family [Bryocella elongata]|uniref:Protein CcmA, bactofilin family n=1 Tax=Bryocella elongata TaxID=863522 RepID=A0A1H5U0D6_9BACT|nr:polymer-forming cytoskeletal protein [Bryocella elongata]SEF68469.1 protein CcmA, bactofilin family [Bryocella elongata]
MNSAEGATIIGLNTKVQGELSGTESLLIEGEVEGTITLPGGRVTIGDQGRVRATIFAQEILVSGRVHGDLQATGFVQLRGNSMVLGDITSPRFTIEEDAMLRGHVDPVTPSTPHENSSATRHDATELPSALAAAERQIQGAVSGSEATNHPSSSTTTGEDGPSLF